jgi:hypothetical protein
MADTVHATVEYLDTVRAADPDGDPLLFSFLDRPADMELYDSIVRWAPGYEDTGSYRVAVKVSDPKGSYDELAWTFTVIAPPLIAKHPDSVSLYENQSFTLRVSARGPGLSYQWQQDGDNILGARDSTYAVPVAALTHDGVYRCIVRNSFGVDTSHGVRVRVTEYVTPTLYVKGDATGKGDGSSWTDAFTDLQEAIDSARQAYEVWVAAGTYYPTRRNGGSGERYRSFQMKAHVALLGGFAGTETKKAQRDWKGNRTILSGDIGTVDDSSDNCYHVFYHTGDLLLGRTAVLDGFIVSGGVANGSGEFSKGGAIYNHNATPR